MPRVNLSNQSNPRKLLLLSHFTGEEIDQKDDVHSLNSEFRLRQSVFLDPLNSYPEYIYSFQAFKKEVHIPF